MIKYITIPKDIMIIIASQWVAMIAIIFAIMKF